jgi:hypothetical protein
MTEIRKENIYTLSYKDSSNFENIFYIGRSIDVKKRKYSHEYSSKKGTEDKYVFIRSLESKGIEWVLTPIIEINTDDYLPDYERFYVIKYARMGHVLTNMKHGDVARSQEIARQIDDKDIRTVKDVKKDRIKQESMHKSQELMRQIKAGEIKEAQFKDAKKDEAYKVRLNNLRLLSKEYSNEELSIRTKIDIRRIQSLINDKAKYKKEENWARKIERNMALEKNWMDINRTSLNMDSEFSKIRKKDAQIKTKNNIILEKKKEKEQIKDAIIVAENRKERLKWFLMMHNGGEYKHLKSISKYVEVHNELIISNEISESYESIYTLNAGSLDFKMPLILDNVLNESYFKNRCNEEGKNWIDYTRKMNLLWLCYKNNGLKEIANALSADYKSLYAYTKWNDSISIPNTLARLIEDKLDYGDGWMDIPREYYLDKWKTIKQIDFNLNIINR